MNRITREQAAIIGAFTGISCGPFEDIHKYAEKVLGYPILTHEFASPKMSNALKDASKPDFLAICAETAP